MRQRLIRAAAVGGGIVVILLGCTPQGFPEDPQFSNDADLAMPDLVPLAPILAETSAPRDPVDPDPALAARGADLRARAEALRNAAE